MKNNVTGWKDVFSFTLTQVLKSKAYSISFILLVLIVLVSMPIASKLLFNNTEDVIAPNSISETEGGVIAPSPISKIYVNNTTFYTNIDFKDMKNIDAFRHIEIESMSMDYDSMVHYIT